MANPVLNGFLAGNLVGSGADKRHMVSIQESVGETSSQSVVVAVDRYWECTSALVPKSSSFSSALLKCCLKTCFCPKPCVGMGVLSNHWCNCASLHNHIFRLAVFILTINVPVTTWKCERFGNVLYFIRVLYGPLSAVWAPLRTEQLKGRKGQQCIHSLYPVLRPTADHILRACKDQRWLITSKVL